MNSPGQAKRTTNHVNGDVPVAIAAQEDDMLSDEEFDTSIASVESIDDYTNVRYNLYAMSVSSVLYLSSLYYLHLHLPSEG